jgi:hypothetical protein|tara:strand:- start:13454 stop:13750 length:297 start_codon:yes stop_codon:yes gene_type:complete
MQTSQQRLVRTLTNWFLAAAMLSASLAAVVELHALEELVDRPVALFFASHRDTILVQTARFLTDFGKAYWSSFRPLFSSCYSGSCGESRSMHAEHSLS